MNNHTLVGDKLPPLPTKHERVSHRASHKNNDYSSPDEFFIKMKQRISHNLSDFCNFCRISLLAMNKCNLKDVMNALLRENFMHLF